MTVGVGFIPWWKRTIVRVAERRLNYSEDFNRRSATSGGGTAVSVA
jgi:hypothetical protein